MAPLLLKVEEAARELALSRAAVYTLLAQGRIPSIKIGGARRIPLDALRRWVAEQLAEQAAERAP
jgi:excisionase family DNA binding protein